MITFNPSTEQLQLVLVDATSDVGIIVMTGQSLITRSSEDIRARYGKVATAVREWTFVEPPPAGLPETAIVRVVENEISEDRWLNQLFVRGPNGEILAEEKLFTRIQPGCQPQLGCELGCAGLAGCQRECEGLQGHGGQPQAIPPTPTRSSIWYRAPSC